MNEIKGLHSVLREKTVERMKQLDTEIEERKQELREAVSMGDLSENSEFDSAKADLTTLLEEKRYFKELLDIPTLPVRNTDIIEPGCIIDIEIYGPSKQPKLLHGSTVNGSLNKFSLTSQNTNSSSGNGIDLTTLTGNEAPDFKGTLLFGGATSKHTCSSDHVFLEDTPVGKGINGKPSGVYEIEGPVGFLLVYVKKVKENDAKEVQTGYSFKK